MNFQSTSKMFQQYAMYQLMHMYFYSYTWNTFLCHDDVQYTQSANLKTSDSI